MRLFASKLSASHGETHASVVVHRGRLVAERYADGKGRNTPFCSWSMAKSITHALVGVLVREGKLAVDDLAPVPEWRGAGDARSDIRIEHLLRMVDGLDFDEDYVDTEVSHVIEMLFGSGKQDVAAYAIARPAPRHHSTTTTRHVLSLPNSRPEPHARVHDLRDWITETACISLLAASRRKQESRFVMRFH